MTQGAQGPARRGVLVPALAALIPIVATASFVAGAAWQRARFEDQRLYWFGQYSAHLRELAEQQRTTKLTNDILLFDTSVRPALGRADVLQNTMYQILEMGPYLRHRTTEPSGSNAAGSR